jgi:hypothetical protein
VLGIDKKMPELPPIHPTSRSLSPEDRLRQTFSSNSGGCISPTASPGNFRLAAAVQDAAG